MLSWRDPLRTPARVVVAGVSGVGKSTLARRIADARDLPYTEIDGLFHGAGWMPRPQFLADVDLLTQAPAWITEWQYRDARPLLSARADTLVWLDLPSPVALSRVLRRTIIRSRTRVELRNGNTEPGMWHAITNSEGIIRWALKHQRTYRRTVPITARDHPHLQVVRLRSQREVDAWLAGPLIEQ
ncbi:AAA family ATPase [Frigoribacterium sp. CG_9.8]|uniref:AAA family ATPase n=1 Tax=Frigoribacterium sp. CG_9.8 TaxID=2787733 RepID=UPI0018CA514C|nr:AAA family ATPase [Frigoribacterium sp. CG_9.8]MBG6107355.1 adenylate kinase family enzyme [Frigoribacterium sp. CG_9.8]